MAGSIYDLLASALGQPDPRQELVQAMAGGASTPGTPQPADPTQAAGGTGAGTTAPPQPQVYQSPPQLVQLYSDLLKRSDMSTSFDRGLGLIGASLAHPENRDSILRAFGGDSNAEPTSLVNNLLALRANQTAATTKAAQRAALPAIASKYGLDIATAQYLFDTGKLDSVIAEAEKPDNQIVTDPNTGQSHIVDKKTGTIGPALGPAKEREVEIITDPNTNKQVAVDKVTKQPIGNQPDNLSAGVRKTEYIDDPTTGSKILVYSDTKEPVPDGAKLQGSGNTEDQKNYNAAMRGLPADQQIPFNDWLAQQNRQKNSSNLGADGVDYGKPPENFAWKRDNAGKVITDANGAPIPVPLAGTKADTTEQDKIKAASKAVEGSIVVQDIDRALGMVSAHKKDWFGNTGIAGAMLRGVEGTDAQRLDATLTSIKGNITVDKLAEMRASSPSGGAVGNVSDYEDKMLQSTLGSLSTGNADDLEYNLKRIRAIFVAAKSGAKSIEDVDKIISEHAGEPPAENGASSIEDLLKKYGTKK